MYFKIKGEEGVRINPLKDDGDFKKEEVEALNTFKELKQSKKKIKYIILRRTITTDNNLSREAIKDMSVKLNFWLDAKNRFLSESLVGLGTEKVNMTEIRRLYEKMRGIKQRIDSLSNFKIEDVYKGLTINVKGITPKDKKEFISRLKKLPMDLMDEMKFMSLTEKYFKSKGVMKILSPKGNSEICYIISTNLPNSYSSKKGVLERALEHAIEDGEEFRNQREDEEHNNEVI